ncbi:MAG: retron system putative HNH endonuclease [Polyangiaceae bacterium]
MRTITKGKEPASLAKHRMTEHCDYENYGKDEKQELREALVREQRAICCYCMNRIVARSDSMKVEHWQCQDSYPDRQLDYSNMLGVCYGGEGQPLADQHCDTRKAWKALKFNPADASHSIEKRVHFNVDGTIESNDGEFNEQLSEILGLNIPVLKNQRLAVIDGLAAWLREYHRQHHRRPDVATLQRQRNRHLSPTGDLAPFAPVAAWWIDQRLAGVGR